MAVLPLKLNKETSTQSTSILHELFIKNWLGVIGDNALRLLVLFENMNNEGETLLGDYDYISQRTGRARASIAEGLSELEAFGFLVINKVINRKTKVYEINFDICPLDDKWVKFFGNSNCKKFCMIALLGKPVKNDMVEKMQTIMANNDTLDIRKTLGRVLYLFTERKGFNINDLLEEERTKMQEDLFPNGFSFGFGDSESESESWQDVLTDEEKKDKELMKVVTHYVAMVDYPTRKDIESIKKALTFCYPYQIKNVITNTKNHPKYGANFKSFQYIYNQTINGQCGTRRNNKAKQKFIDVREVPKRKPNNQTDMGFKRSGLSRGELVQILEEASSSSIDDANVQGVDEAFDFSKLRR